MRQAWIPMVVGALLGPGLPGLAAQEPLPEARRAETVHAAHGIEVPDPYRWMEDMSSPEVRRWVRAQDTWARSYLRGIPARDPVRERVHHAADHRVYGAPVKRGGRYFFTRANSSSTRIDLLVREDGRDRVLLADDELEEGHTLDRLIWPSPDGELVAYGVSAPGSRWMELRFRKVADGRDLPDRVPGLLGRRLSHVSWAPDGSGVRYDGFDPPPEAERVSAPIQGSRLAFHRLGTDHSQDRTLLEPSDPEALLSHRVTDDGRWVVAQESDGGGSTARVVLLDGRSADGEPRTLVEGLEGNVSLVGSEGDELWLYTTQGAPNGRIVGVSVDRPSPANWRDVVPERSDPIDTWTGASAVGESIVVGYRNRGLLELRAFRPSGEDRDGRLIHLPRVGSVWFGVSGRQGDPEMFYALSGFADPGTVYRHDLEERSTSVFRAPDLPYDPGEIVTRMVYYSGPAGDSVPMYLAHHRDTPPDGSRPVMMYGYAFGNWSASPWFRPHMGAWFQAGGAFALPALRGGGEFGAKWARDGSGTNRQNAVDDFLAAGRWLVSEGFTRPELLVAESNSAGASVVAAAVVQEPDRFGAAVLAFPLLDLLRYEAFTGGRRWRSQLGSVENEDEFRALAGYSPVTSADPGRCYPPTLVTPGELDETTPPFHAYKFVAALQWAQACENPVLLRVSWETGHAYGRDQVTTVENLADQIVFLLGVLDMDREADE